MTHPPLPACDEVHLWLLEHRETNTSLLSEKEQTRLQAYRFEKDRQRYRFTQSAKRIILARYLSQHPADLVFKENKQGKPSLPEIEFNLSHTEGRSILAVSSQSPLGIDIEKVLPQPDLLELSHRVFTSPNKPSSLTSPTTNVSPLSIASGPPKRPISRPSAPASKSNPTKSKSPSPFATKWASPAETRCN